MGEILEEFSCKGMDGKAELEKHGRQHVYQEHRNCSRGWTHRPFSSDADIRET